MKLASTVTLNMGGGTTVSIDLTKVKLTKEQRQIAGKLFSMVSEIPVGGTKNPCEAGQCLASQHLTKDEFEKIRGVKVKLASLARPSWVIIDFCIHPLVHDN